VGKRKPDGSIFFKPKEIEFFHGMVELCKVSSEKRISPNLISTAFRTAKNDVATFDIQSPQ
jgi:hypothetical protein